jgi:hypothetical protein
MAANEVRVGDIGTVFEITLMDGASVVNISTATVKEIIFVKPRGTKLTKTAAFSTTGADGKIKYAALSGDLDTEGVWQIQAHITMPTGDWRSDIQTFEVFANL